MLKTEIGVLFGKNYFNCDIGNITYDVIFEKFLMI